MLSARDTVGKRLTPVGGGLFIDARHTGNCIFVFRLPRQLYSHETFCSANNLEWAGQPKNKNGSGWVAASINRSPLTGLQKRIPE
jgi:hypothetical protein